MLTVGAITMKTIQTERKQPETLKECDSMLFSNRCKECVIGAYSGVCTLRNELLEIAEKNGDITETRSECWTGYVYVDTCQKCGKRYRETEYHECEE